MGGGNRKQARAQQRKKKGRGGRKVSGNPAKRAAQASGKPQADQKPTESPFGIPQTQGSDFQLPPNVAQMLKDSGLGN